MKTIFFKVLPIFMMSFLSSCDEAVDCIDNDGPVFKTAAILPDAVVGLDYDEMILVEVKNEPRDDDFQYYIESESRLPFGLELDNRGSTRRAYIRGIPTEPGEYRFTLFVRVYDDGFDPGFDSEPATGNLCFTTNRKEFILVVLP